MSCMHGDSALEQYQRQENVVQHGIRPDTLNSSSRYMWIFTKYTHTRTFTFNHN
jgi:hypothetical protein